MELPGSRSFSVLLFLVVRHCTSQAHSQDKQWKCVCFFSQEKDGGVNKLVTRFTYWFKGIVHFEIKQRSGSSSLSALKLKSFSSLVKWWAAHYTRHMKGHVSLRDLYGLCVNARTDSGKSLAVWMQQIWRYRNKCRNTLPVYFPESLCERGFIETVTYTCHYMTDRLERFDLKTSKLDLLKKKRHLHLGCPWGKLIDIKF